MEQLHNFSSSAAKLSSETIGRATYFAQTAGAKLAGHKPREPNVNTERGRPSKPGILNKSMIAFGVVSDGLEHAGKTLLGHGQEAATKVVSHKFGPEAGQVARRATGSIKNVGLVYIDAAGVSRRAVIKGVAKGVVIGHVKGGGDVIVPGGDQRGEKVGTPGSPGRAGPSGTGSPPPGPPPSYGSAMQQGNGGQMYFPPPPEKGGNQAGEYRY
jgi:spartin